jgi:hypothetical protein
MTFKSEFTVGDIATVAGLLFAAVGLLLTWRQLMKDAAQKRAEFIISIFNQYVTDPEASAIFYEVEYGRFVYGAGFHGSPQEKQLDRLLSYFEKIAALYFMETINREDLELVRYDFLRVFQDKSVQAYFRTLDANTDRLGVDGGTFANYRKVAEILDGKPPVHKPSEGKEKTNMAEQYQFMDKEGLRDLIDLVANRFEAETGIRVEPGARLALLDPALPHLEKVNVALAQGKITTPFLEDCIRKILQNGRRFMRGAASITASVVSESMDDDCPYLFWC